MIRNALVAVCHDCRERKPGCAVCAVNGTNAFGDRDQRIVTLCGPCRRRHRGRCRLHPQHQPKKVNS